MYRQYLHERFSLSHGPVACLTHVLIYNAISRKLKETENPSTDNTSLCLEQKAYKEIENPRRHIKVLPSARTLKETRISEEIPESCHEQKPLLENKESERRNHSSFDAAASKLSPILGFCMLQKAWEAATQEEQQRSFQNHECFFWPSASYEYSPSPLWALRISWCSYIP
jgi:hypothetical protein